MPRSSLVPDIATLQPKHEEDDSDDDWFNEEEDYSSDDEDDDPNVFRTKRELRTTESHTLTTGELHEALHQGEIHLTPPYQRDVVWTEPKQIRLIDSIWRNFYIPPLLFVRKHDSDGVEQLVCIDGKQRLTSIQKFLDGQIPCKDKNNKSWWFTSASHDKKSNRSTLSEGDKARFRKKFIKCDIYSALSDEAEREQFQRVQLGVALTSAEKWKSIISPWAKWIGDIEQRHILVNDGLSDHLNWNLSRAREFQNAVNLVYFCDGIDEEVVYSHTKAERWLNREDAPPLAFKTRIDQVLRELLEIVTTPSLKVHFTRVGKVLAPVEFGFIGVLLYVFGNRDLKTKARAIDVLRTTVHRDFPSRVTNNDKVNKSMWKYINFLRDNPRATEIPAGALSAGSSKKRKLHPKEVEDEYRPPRGLLKKLKARKS